MTSGSKPPPAHAWNARDYAENSSAQMEWAQELIAKLHLRGDESVLDLGCGDGKVSARLAEAVPQGSVLGIDLSFGMIGLASERFPEAEYPNLAFRRGRRTWRWCGWKSRRTWPEADRTRRGRWSGGPPGCRNVTPRPRVSAGF